MLSAFDAIKRNNRGKFHTANDQNKQSNESLFLVIDVGASTTKVGVWQNGLLHSIKEVDTPHYQRPRYKEKTVHELQKNMDFATKRHCEGV